MVDPGGLYWQPIVHSYITSQVSLFDITLGVDLLQDQYCSISWAPPWLLYIFHKCREAELKHAFAFAGFESHCSW